MFTGVGINLNVEYYQLLAVNGTTAISVRTHMNSVLVIDFLFAY